MRWHTIFALMFCPLADALLTPLPHSYYTEYTAPGAAGPSLGMLELPSAASRLAASSSDTFSQILGTGLPAPVLPVPPTAAALPGLQSLDTGALDLDSIKLPDIDTAELRHKMEVAVQDLEKAFSLFTQAQGAVNSVVGPLKGILKF